MKTLNFKISTLVLSFLVLGSLISLSAKDKKTAPKSYEEVVTKCEEIKSEMSKAEPKKQGKFKASMKSHQGKCTKMYIAKCKEGNKDKKMSKEEKKEMMNSCKSSAESSCSACNG